MELTTYPAGSTVRGGFYVNFDKLDLVVVSGKEGSLPDEDGRYARVPAAAALVLGPLLGGVFVGVAPCLAVLRLVRRLRRWWLQDHAAAPSGDAEPSP
jgi:hypothetical protein